MNQILLGDCLDVLKTLPDESVHAVVTDPPYGLGTREPTGEEIIAYLQGGDLDHGGDFMGRNWSIPPVAVWRDVYRVLKPGGHLLSFGGTRTFDLISIGIRAAGFAFRDTIAQQFGVQCLQWIQGCLTDDAEILTQNGWKRGLDVKVGELVAAWDPQTQEISLQPVAEHYVYPWDGEVIAIRNSDTDQLLTPNHRVYHRPRKRKQVDFVRTAWHGEDWECVPAGALGSTNPFKVPTAGKHHGPGVGGLGYAALLGWIWTEGGFDKLGCGVRIYQSESANPSKVAEIHSIVGKLVPNFKRYDRERQYAYRGQSRPYTETCWFFTGPVATRVRLDLPGKHPSWDLLWRMTQEEKLAFWDAAMKGDGCNSQFYQKGRADLEWAQALAATIGKSGRVSMRRHPRLGGHLALRNSATTYISVPHLKAAAPVPYKGNVWCVEVASGAFVARRNNRVFCTGNSGFPKSASIEKGLIKQGYSKEDAAPWAGFGTSLKPSWEPIIVARKPIAESTIAKQVLKTGTGAINIDGCRVGTALRDLAEMQGRSGASTPNKIWGPGANGSGPQNTGIWEPTTTGRWPASVLLIHLPTCKVVGTKKVPAPVINRFTDGMKPFGDGAGHEYKSEQTGDSEGQETIPVYECEDGCPVKVLDEQSGTSSSLGGANGGKFKGPVINQTNSGFNGGNSGSTAGGFGDTGGASRFYSQFQPDAPFLYSPKVSKAERDRGLPKGTNRHPTVKPLAVCRWLVRLVTPPGGTVLDPYCGSGSICLAAQQEGFNFIGIERDPESHHVAVLRTTRKPDLFEDLEELE